MTALTIEQVEVSYRARGRGSVRAVAGVDLQVAAGEVVGLVGESGCGKSSLARVAAGLTAPTAGRILIGDTPVAPVGWRRRPAALTRLQMIFQDPGGSLNPRRTIESQLLDGIPADLTGSARTERLVQLLERVGMSDDARRHYPHQFSGGQRQRLAIARALATEPEIIIADEPVTALDASAQAQVVSLLLSLVRELDVGLLFISHDLALVHEIADRTAVMYLGKIVEQAPTRALMAAPRHPYTRALVEAIPQISAHPNLPNVLRGEVPDPAQVPSGCRFRPRCAHARAICLTEPQLREVPGGLVSCHRVEEIAAENGVTELSVAKRSVTESSVTGEIAMEASE
ncbi:ABC transporter ATP-binding protein [Nakamurella lactea]|uniref:ABC transporter ATP-binding protein n=1 Tax=Nakamurella lactea TaxID=459515 RepID=UPI0004091827|nr:ABC transporter ATP-binding protein [Nakamurella lactea]